MINKVLFMTIYMHAIYAPNSSSDEEYYGEHVYTRARTIDGSSDSAEIQRAIKKDETIARRAQEARRITEKEKAEARRAEKARRAEEVRIDALLLALQVYLQTLLTAETTHDATIELHVDTLDVIGVLKLPSNAPVKFITELLSDDLDSIMNIRREIANLPAGQLLCITDLNSPDLEFFPAFAAHRGKYHIVYNAMTDSVTKLLSSANDISKYMSLFQYISTTPHGNVGLVANTSLTIHHDPNVNNRPNNTTDEFLRKLFPRFTQEQLEEPVIASISIVSYIDNQVIISVLVCVPLSELVALIKISNAGSQYVTLFNDKNTNSRRKEIPISEHDQELMRRPIMHLHNLLMMRKQEKWCKFLTDILTQIHANPMIRKHLLDQRRGRVPVRKSELSQRIPVALIYVCAADLRVLSWKLFRPYVN